LTSYAIDWQDQAARDATVGVTLRPATVGENVVEVPPAIAVFWRWTQWSKTNTPFGIVEGPDTPASLSHGYYYSIFGELQNFLATDELLWTVDVVNSTLNPADYIADSSARGRIFVYGFGGLSTAGSHLNLPIVINGVGFSIPTITWV
jgi:hypothetical protein